MGEGKLVLSTDAIGYDDSIRLLRYDFLVATDNITEEE